MFKIKIIMQNFFVINFQNKCLWVLCTVVPQGLITGYPQVNQQAMCKMSNVYAFMQYVILCIEKYISHLKSCNLLYTNINIYCKYDNKM
jgi:hypothetical protein